MSINLFPDEYEPIAHKGMNHLRHTSIESEIDDASTSIRRWWWEYLKLSKDYWLVCQTAVNGVPETYDGSLAQIYRDFGNIYDCSFEDWWRRTGSDLFKEQQLPPCVEQITSVESAVAGNRAGKILVEIPLQLSMETIERQIKRILDSYANQRPSNRLETSTSKYPINVTLARLNVLKTTHEVYNLHRELIEKPKALANLGLGKEGSNFEVRADLYRIGVLLRLSPSNERLIGDKSEVARRANTMRSTVSRFLARASGLISNVELGVFPKDERPDKEVVRFSSAQDVRNKELEARWWALDLSSSLSANKVAAARRIQYVGD